MIDSSPFPEEFQDEIFRLLLGARPVMAAFAEKIAPSFFDNPSTASLWALVKQHYTANRQIPSVGVGMEIIRKTYPESTSKAQDQRKALGDKFKGILERPVNPDPYIGTRLREFITFCAVRNVIMEAAEPLMQGKFDPNIVSKFRDASRAGEIDADIGMFAKTGSIDTIERYADPDLNPPIPTGLYHLDLELGGGLRRGQLGFFMAPPKGSKSTYLLNVAHNAPTVGVKKNVLYLTLELSEELQSLRFAIRTTMLEKSMIMRDPIKYRTLYQRRAAAIFSPNHDCIIKFMPPYVCTPGKIRALLDNIIGDRDIPIDELCVDYFELLGSDVPAEKDYMTQTRIATDLRQIGVDYNLAVWTASRTNREAEKAIRSGNWISPDHMSGAYEKLGVCDVAIAGQRYRDGMAIVPIAFRNEGGNRKIDCSLQPSKMCITTRGFIADDEMPEGDDSASEEDRPKRRKPQGKPGSSFPGRASAKVNF